MQHFQRNTLAIAILAACSTFSASTHAATLPAAEFTLDEIVVTATRTAQTADETLAAVTVITRKDIERMQAQSVQEVLAGQAGISIDNSGGAGKATNVYLRGTNSGHTLVLIDGVKIGSATLGAVAFQDIPLDAVERIEIVRGPLSSLYGSEAIGGVIHLFTRKGGGETTPSASVGLGSYGTVNASAGITGGGTDSWYNARVSHAKTDGFNAQPAAQLDADGYENTAFSIRGGHRFNQSTEIDAHFLRAKGDNEYDNAWDALSDKNTNTSVQLAAGVRMKHRVNEQWRTELSAGQSRDESDDFNNGISTGVFNTRRNTATWQNDLDLGARRQLTLGVDYQEDKVTSSTAYAVKSRDNTGVFTQWMAGVGAHDFKLSLRRDDNSQFGTHDTGNAAWGMDMGNELRARLSYGTAFKAPTFNDLYYPGLGNPAIRPEKSESYEIGLAGKTGRVAWTANAFSTQVDSLIAWVNVSGPSWTPMNVDKARMQGVETSVTTALAGWDVRSSLTLQDTKQLGGTNDGKSLHRRPDQVMRVDLDRAVGSWKIGSTLRAEGKRYNELANTTKLGGYGLIDLRAETKLSKDWQFQAKLENLADKTYQTVAGYNQAGRGLYLTLRYQPKK